MELSIRFHTPDKDDPTAPITVSLFRPDTGVAAEPLPFQVPLDDEALQEIHWYLEIFHTWPTEIDYERARRVEANLKTWGLALRDSVLAGAEASRIWQQFWDAAGEEGKLLTIDATAPAVLRLPWELLADEPGHVFAQGVSVRRRLRKTVGAAVKPVQLPARILVVVARPDDAGFIDPRADARALLDATAALGDQVEVEFLYPPTLQALTGRLRDREAPPVHVVHFDGHGVYDRRRGLGFLLFENEGRQSDLVDAERLGTLLSRAGTPLMVLSACQSAAQETANPYASVAASLIQAGVGSVLAMNYSVLVVAAHKFVAAFYAALADGRSIGQSVDEGRFALLQDVERHTIIRRDEEGKTKEHTIRLKDWFLPALYQQADDPALFAPDAGAADAEEEEKKRPVPIPARQTYPGLVRLIQTLFNKEELRGLCHALGVQYDDLPGDGNAAKALSLVELAERRDAVPRSLSAVLPTLLIYIFLSRYFLRGLMSGNLKG